MSPAIAVAFCISLRIFGKGALLFGPAAEVGDVADDGVGFVDGERCLDRRVGVAFPKPGHQRPDLVVAELHASTLPAVLRLRWLGPGRATIAP